MTWRDVRIVLVVRRLPTVVRRLVFALGGPFGPLAPVLTIAGAWVLR